MIHTEKAQKIILLVEDETPILSTLTFLLKRAGYAVFSSINGLEALEVIKELKRESKKIDLLITDIQMNMMNGMQLIDAVNVMKLDVPILVITGYGNKETVVELLRKGCMEYIDKPFKPDFFLARVKEVLDKEQARLAKLNRDRMELQRNFENYKLRSEKLFSNMQNAARVFNNLLDQKPGEQDIPCFCRSLPREFTGGDLFLIRKTAAGFDILVADVAGHDMGASFYAVLIKGLFDDQEQVTGDGVCFFNILNNYLLKHINEKILITAAFLGLNLELMKGEIVLAGHYSPVQIRGTDCVVFPQGGSVIGVLDKVEFIKHVVDLVPGERFIIYTDGVINVTRFTDYNQKEKKLQQEGLLEMMRKWNHLPLDEMVDHVFTDVLFYCDQKPTDDMLLAGVEIPETGKKGG